MSSSETSGERHDEQYGPPMAGEVIRDPGGGGSVQIATPPPGDRYEYDVEIEYSSGHAVAVVLSVPHGQSGAEFETAVVLRQGGPTEADQRYRERLYAIVGEAVVAGGRIEAAMKRLVLILDGGEGAFVDVDRTWTDLDGKLRQLLRTAVADRVSLATSLLAALDRAEEQRLKAVRDTLVHGYHWTFDVGHVMVSRFMRKTGPMQVLDSEQTLRVAVGALTEHADELERLAWPYWPVAVLRRP